MITEVNWIEWIGYAGSLLVAISLTMSAMLRLRWINLLGAIFFTVYSIIIQAIPVALVNGFIIIIDLYYIIKIYRTKEFFKLMTTEKNNPYILHFLHYYKKTIQHNFPNYQSAIKTSDTTILILRNMDIAGLFMGHKKEEQELIIDLDFATPQYQDFKTGHFLFEKNKALFKSQGIESITIENVNKHQKPYYQHIGFIENNDKTFTKTL